MRFRALVVTSSLLFIAALPGAVAAAGPRSGPSEHDRIVAYWTHQRIANAKPRDYVMTPSRGLVPAVKPGGGGGSGAVTGASWPSGGIVEKQTGRVLFSDADGDWICSASALSDGNMNDGYSLVLSAGHCAYDGSGGWATNWMYIPDFDAHPTYSCASTEYGCWTARALVLSKAFVTGGGFGDDTVAYDWSIAVVGPGGKDGTTQLDAMGGYALKTSANAIGDTVWPFGYPAAGKYHGKDLTYCKGPTIRDPYGDPTWGVACDMTGGSSGGPWLVDTTAPATSAGKIASLNSYGYTGLKYMFGPIFNANTLAVYNAANAYNGSGMNHITVP
jgi:V8-like Glu-specific endopeptidase